MELPEWAKESDTSSRAMRFAWAHMSVPTGWTQTLAPSNPTKKRISIYDWMHKNKKQYFAELEKYGLKPNVYDNTL